MTNGTHVDLCFVIAHGTTASSVYAAGALNEVERESHAWPGADVICFGHAHRPGHVPVASMIAEYGKEVKQHEAHLMRCGSLLRNYVHGSGNYATKHAWKPSVMRMPRIRVTVDSVGKGANKEGVKHVDYISS